ncbi:MAG: DUF4019 domain-containing protein [Luteolibacter sp.]
MDKLPEDAAMENPPQPPLVGLNPADLLAQGVAGDTIGNPYPFQPPSLEEMAALFPQFEILELIGKGGMGAVYKVRQKELDRIVALKILPPAIGETPGFSARFAREAKALAKLNHPGIVTLYEFGSTSSHQPSTPDHQLFYFLMEFVDGVNLGQLMHAGRISPREALAIVPQICDALQFAHDQGIVHRDIKPENILLDRLGRVKVADFGIAKLSSFVVPPSGGLHEDVDRLKAGLHTDPLLTEVGKVMGTPQYMAPEQIEHPEDVDHRADIYALGVVFYQMLTGELPGKDLQAPSRRVKIDVRLDEIVMHALEKSPELRFQNASLFKTQVEIVAAGGTKPEAGDQRGKGDPRFSRTAILATCFAILSFILVAWGVVLTRAAFATLGASGMANQPSNAMPLALGVAGFGCVLTSCVLGWIAVSQIRRSAGKLQGMWLAVFDGLLFPLLALDYAIAYLLHEFGKGYLGWTQNYDPVQSARLAVVSIVLWLIVDSLIIGAVWRAVNPSKERRVGSESSTLGRVIKIAVPILAIIGIVIWLAAPKHPDYVITGRVIDSVTGHPVPQAIVSVERDDEGEFLRQTEVNAQGGYELRWPEDADLLYMRKEVRHSVGMVVSVAAPGYEKQAVSASQTRKVGYYQRAFDFQLPPENHELQALVEVSERQIQKVTIEIFSDGGITLDDKAISPAGLNDELSRMHRDFADLAVMIRSSSGVIYTKVVEVMEVCRKAGISRIEFAIDGPNSPGKMKIDFDRAGDTMQKIVVRFRSDYGVRLCFENLDVALKRDGKPAGSPLDSGETERLRDAYNFSYDSKLGGFPILDLGARYQGRIVADSVEDFLNQVTRDTPFCWHPTERGKTWVIMPREGSRLEFPVTLETENLAVDEAVMRVTSQRPSGSITYVQSTGWSVAKGATDSVPWLSVKCKPQKFDQVPAWQVLCDITEGARPDSVWALYGYKEQRALVVPPGPSMDYAVVSQAQTWLCALDSGGFLKTWEQAAEVFRTQVTPDQWRQAQNALRKHLGEPKFRKLKNVTEATSLSDAPDGRYLVMQFETVFASEKRLSELVTFQQEKDGIWRAAACSIK